MQKEQIRTIQNERPTDLAPGTGQSGGPPPQFDFRQMEADKVAKIVGLLTPAQVEVWNSLTGDPYAGPWPNPFGRGRRGRGGGGGPRGGGGPG
jgi:hypothetical protein